MFVCEVAVLLMAMLPAAAVDPIAPAVHTSVLDAHCDNACACM